MWERFTAEGTKWEVRVVPDPTETGQRAADPAQVLEFRSSDSNRPPRRLCVPAARAHDMDAEHLRIALRQARPIGGDFYGRPGKRMPDVHDG